MQKHIQTWLQSRGYDFYDLENGYLICEYCNKGPVGEIHHIPCSFRGKRIDDDPEILIGMCVDCHKNTHTQRENDFDFRLKLYQIVKSILDKPKDLFANFK